MGEKKERGKQTGTEEGENINEKLRGDVELETCEGTQILVCQGLNSNRPRMLHKNCEELRHILKQISVFVFF